MAQSREFNDFDYSLVHKFAEDANYYEFYKESLRQGRIVYLDNSLFETEVMFDHNEFAKTVMELGSINPSSFYYVVPDALEESKITMDSFNEFIAAHNDLPGKSIGVVQGKNYKEMSECYGYMCKNADMVAITFNNSWYQNEFPNEKNKYHSLAKGRQSFIDTLMSDGIWDHNKEHHLLGCGLPQEFKKYKNIKSIVSCDTSNPIVMGILGHRYNGVAGLEVKESIKLIDLFDANLDEKQMDDVFYNIQTFKEICKDSK